MTCKACLDGSVLFPGMTCADCGRNGQDAEGDDPCSAPNCTEPSVWQAPSGEWWCDDHAEEARGCWYCYRVVVGEHALPGEPARRLCELCLEEAKAGDELRRRERAREAPGWSRTGR
jgi:hypothetical protein